MTAEVFEEVAYVADCEDCDYHSEFYETKSEAEVDAEKHNEVCPGPDADTRTERERFQDALDAAVRGDHL